MRRHLVLLPLLVALWPAGLGAAWLPTDGVSIDCTEIELLYQWPEGRWTEATIAASNPYPYWIVAEAASAAGLVECSAGWIPPEGRREFRVRVRADRLEVPRTGACYADALELRFEGRQVMGDLDGDGAVTIFDVIDLIEQLGGAGGRGDLDANGVVDVLDLLELLARFGGTGGGMML